MHLQPMALVVLLSMWPGLKHFLEYFQEETNTPPGLHQRPGRRPDLRELETAQQNTCILQDSAPSTPFGTLTVYPRAPRYVVGLG